MTTGRVDSRTLLWLSLWESAGHLIRAWRLMLPAFLIVVADVIARYYLSDLTFRGAQAPDLSTLGRYQLVSGLISAGWISLALAIIGRQVSGPDSPSIPQRVGKSLFLVFVLWNLSHIGHHFAQQFSVQIWEGLPEQLWSTVGWGLFILAGIVQALIFAVSGAWLGVKMVEREEGFVAFLSGLRCFKSRPIEYLAIALLFPVLQAFIGLAPIELTMLLVAAQFGAFVLVTEATLGGEEVLDEARLAEPITSQDWTSGFGRAVETMAVLGVVAVFGEFLRQTAYTSGLLVGSFTIEPSKMFSISRTAMSVLETSVLVLILSVVYSMLIVYAVCRESVLRAEYWRRLRQAYPACLTIEAVGVFGIHFLSATGWVLLTPDPKTLPPFEFPEVPYILARALLWARLTAAQIIAVRDQVGAKEAFDRSSMVFRRNVLPLTFLALISEIGWQAVRPMWDTPAAYAAALLSVFTLSLIAAILPAANRRRNPSFTHYPREFDAQMPPFRSPDESTSDD